MKNNIGKLLIEYRKRRNLTQKELGDMIGVSFKTISKWECGKGLPDVSLLENLSEILGISIDELLKGNSEHKTNKSKVAKYILLFLLLISILYIGIYLIKKLKSNHYQIINEDYPCTMIGNYYIKLITDSNDENYKYITITMYQMEGIYSVKIPSSIANQLLPEKRYKITLKTKANYQNVSLDTLFNNSEIINVTESLEDEIWSKYTCD